MVALRTDFSVLFFARLEIFSNGQFMSEEDDFILKHINENPNYNIDYLSKSLNRHKKLIYHHIAVLKSRLSLKSNTSFAITEDILIMKFVFKGKKPENYEEMLNYSSRKSRGFWDELAKELKRRPGSFGTHWKRFICSTLLGYFNGSLETPWRKDFCQYVIDSKADVISSIDFSPVLQKRPFLTRHKLINFLYEFTGKGEEKKLPLYQRVQMKMSSVDDDINKRTLNRQKALIEAFESI